MLTINLLLPPRRVKNPLLIAGAVVVSVVLVGLAVWSYVFFTHTSQLRRDLATATQAVARLRPIAQHVQELKRNADRMRARRDLLQQLLATQVPASHILEMIVSVVPRDVWLTSVTAGTSDVTFEGYTFSYPSVARFMVELEESGAVRHIDLAMSQRETILNREVLKFRMTGDLVATHPLTSQKGATP